MPSADHKYAGHDINRDGFMMNLAESRNLARFFYAEWHPQVFLTMHQMEGDGPRFFAPPNSDPIDPNYDPIIWREAALLGASMTLELERDQRTGVVSSSPFDYYWPGYEDSVPLGHNTVCLLTEVASARVASTVAETAAEARTAEINLPAPVARRPVAASRHRGLQPQRDARAPARRRGLPRRDRAELLRHGEARGGGRRAGRARSRSSSRPSSTTCSRSGSSRSCSLLGGIEIQRAQEPFRAGATALSGRQRHHLPVAAVSRVRQDAARAAELPRAGPPTSGRTTRRAGRCRRRWAWTSGPSSDRSTSR